MRQLQLTSLRKIGVVLMAAVAIVGWPPLAARAQGQGSQYITITPAAKSIEADPGQQKTGLVTVVNQGSDAFSVKMSVLPYSVKGADYEPQYVVGDTRKADASSWVTLSTTGADELQPTKMIDVTYTINVPRNATPGGHYFVIFAESSPLSTGAGVTAHNRVGQVVYLNVSGDVVRSGDASLPTLNTFVSAQKTVLPYNVKNTGNTHFTSTVKATVRDAFGNVVFDKSQERVILPDTERTISYDWEGYSSFGIYHIERSISLPDGRIVSSSTTVYAINPIITAAVAAAIILLLAIIIIRRRRR